MVPPDRRSSLLIRRGSSISSPIREVELDQQYRLIKKLGQGKFASVYSAEDVRRPDSNLLITLRIFPKSQCKLSDFSREFNASYFLSPHPYIVDTYEGTYVGSDVYFFVQEPQPAESLRDFIEAGASSSTVSYNNLSPRQSNAGFGPSGSPGPNCLAFRDSSVVQKIVGQVVAALEFMHNENLVHGNLTADNVLLFDKLSWKVKLTDFSMTRQKGCMVKQTDEQTGLFYRAHELCETLPKEGYCVDMSQDVWAVGILVYYCLRASYPWTKASIVQKSYYEWDQFSRRKTHQLPQKWTRFTEDAVKMFKRLLAGKPKDRCTVKEIKKFLKDKWIKESKSICEEVQISLPTSPSFCHPSPQLLHSDSQAQRGRKSKSVSEVPSHVTHKSAFINWIAHTMSTMTEISEQVVSAHQ